LAEVYFHAGDFANARKWFARRLEMDSGEPTEEVYWAMLRLGHSMEKLDEPWPDHDAYLRAWEFRPTRAEPVCPRPTVRQREPPPARLLVCPARRRNPTTRQRHHRAAPRHLHLRDQIHGRYWLHLDHGWQFFAPDNLITRLIAVLDAEPQVFQVGINLADAAELTGINAPEHTVRRTADAGRYVLAESVARGPSMFHTARLHQAGGVGGTDPDPITDLARSAAAAGLHTASLDEVLCITAV
jgi:hypothetical protein